MVLSVDQSDRFGRQLRLPHVGEQGQERLAQARVLVVGLGGLGSPLAMYLAAAGVGELLLSDFDRVELSNLQRQIIHRQDAVGDLKVDSAARVLSDLNPACRLTCLPQALDEDAMAEAVGRCDVVVDCSDNFETRFLVNAVAMALGKPLVSGAAIRMEGQVAAFFADQGPCYRCLYGDAESMAESCAAEGVLGPVVGLIGTMQALMVLNILLGQREAMLGRLWLLDGLALEWRGMKLARDPACPLPGEGGV